MAVGAGPNRLAIGREWVVGTDPTADDVAFSFDFLQTPQALGVLAGDQQVLFFDADGERVLGKRDSKNAPPGAEFP